MPAAIRTEAVQTTMGRDYAPLTTVGASRAHLRTLKGPLCGWLMRCFVALSLIGMVSFLTVSYNRQDMWSHLNITRNRIIVITPTYQRPERLGDLTMLSQVLSQVPNVFWVVVEDGNTTFDFVQRLLDRSGVEYVYMAETDRGLPCRGWAHRNFAMQWLRDNRERFGSSDVVYFADDDNAYDLRLFRNYIPNVRKFGIWGVGTSASGIVESPIVEKGKIVGWDVIFWPHRKFATDMAGFAVNLDVLINANATFHIHCAGTVPEECLIRQLNVPLEEFEPFGFDSTPIDVLVWHRSVRKEDYKGGRKVPYVIERRKPKKASCERLLMIRDMTYEQADSIYQQNLAEERGQ